MVPGIVVKDLSGSVDTDGSIVVSYWLPLGRESEAAWLGGARYGSQRAMRFSRDRWKNCREGRCCTG